MAMNLLAQVSKSSWRFCDETRACVALGVSPEVSRSLPGLVFPASILSVLPLVLVSFPGVLLFVHPSRKLGFCLPCSSAQLPRLAEPWEHREGDEACSQDHPPRAGREGSPSLLAAGPACRCCHHQKTPFSRLESELGFCQSSLCPRGCPRPGFSALWPVWGRPKARDGKSMASWLLLRLPVFSSRQLAALGF